MAGWAVPASAATVRVCTQGVWAPYTTPDGIHTRLLKATIQAMGEAVEFTMLPWSRCLAAVASGEMDGAYDASWTADRAEVALYPGVAFGDIATVFVVRKGAGKGWTESHDAALLPQPIAAPHGYSIVATLKAIEGVAVVDHLATEAEDLAALRRGEIGAMAAEPNTIALEIARARAGDEVEILAPPLVPAKQYFMIVSKRHGGDEAAAKAFADRFSVALAGIIAREASAGSDSGR